MQQLNEATHALILLHGRGGTAANILNLADEFCDESFYVAAPQAPNGSWYPNSFMAENNEPELSASIAHVKRLIDTIATHIPHQKIYLMGFSQGACLALETAARYALPYGAVVAFTGGLIGPKVDPSRYLGDFKGCPIFIGTSENDPHVPLTRVKESQALLESLDAVVTLKVYPGSSHTIHREEIDWVKKNLFKQEGQ